MKNIFLALLLFSLTSCMFNPKAPETGEKFLQGKWEEGTIKHEDKLASFEKYYFKFTCDSFYLNIKSFSKTNLDGGECYNATNWDEFAKGIYTVNKDTIKLNGSFTNEHFRYKPENTCYRNGKIEYNFLFKKISEDSLEIHQTLSSLSHTIVLKERTSCIHETK